MSDGPLELGELSGPGRTTLTITGLERRPTAAPGRRPASVPGTVLRRVLPLVALDVGALGAGWAASSAEAVSRWLDTSALDGPELLVATASLPAWCVLVGAAGGYPRAASGWPPARAVLDAVARFTASCGLALLLLAPDVARRLVVVVPVTTGVCLALRALARRVPVATSRRPVRVLLVGGEAAVEDAARRLAGRRPGLDDAAAAGVRIVGRCVTGPGSADPGVDGAAADVLRRRVTATARAAAADLVLLADTAAIPAPGRRRLAWTLHASGVGLAVAEAPAEVAAHRLRVRALAELAVTEVGPPVFTGPRRMVKSVFDRCGALALVVLLAPLLLAVAAAVRLSGPGPVIFRQERVGRHGERFVMLKFRSMCRDAQAWRARLDAGNDHRTGVLFKMRTDPRITPVGKVLRRLSLDELPQLLNVLRGEMSLVGPRPALPSEVERYEPEVLRRLLVKPGLTGVWQVCGRSDLDWDESVRLDLGYVENWSLAMDCRILLRTVRAVLRGTGAR